MAVAIRFLPCGRSLETPHASAAMARRLLRTWAAVLLLSTTASCQTIAKTSTGVPLSKVLHNRRQDLMKFLNTCMRLYKPVPPTELPKAKSIPSIMHSMSRAAGVSPSSNSIVVDCKGSGDFKTVQAALDSLVKRRKSGNMGDIDLYIKSCIYKEKIAVHRSLSRLTIRGETAKGVFFTWDDTSETVIRGQSNPSKKYGTLNSASTTILADDVVVMDISFINSAGRDRGPNVALHVDSDRVAFYSCRFIGWQDTIYDRYGRHYFRDCYIEGRVDFICGNGQSIYEFCTLYSPVSGAYVAQKRESPGDTTGFIFLRCKILGDGLMQLARAWGQNSRTIFAYCYIENTVHTKTPWSDFDHSSKRDTIFFGEYKNFGPGAVNNKRNDWKGTFVMADAQAAPFLTYAYINQGSWLRFPSPQTKSGPLEAPPRKLAIPPFPPTPQNSNKGNGFKPPAKLPPPIPKSPPSPSQKTNPNSNQKNTPKSPGKKD